MLSDRYRERTIKRFKNCDLAKVNPVRMKSLGLCLQEITVNFLRSRRIEIADDIQESFVKLIGEHKIIDMLNYLEPYLGTEDGYALMGELKEEIKFHESYKPRFE